jgi:hypothetical protein
MDRAESERHGHEECRSKQIGAVTRRHELAGEAPLDLALETQKLDQPRTQQIERDTGH